MATVAEESVEVDIAPVEPEKTEEMLAEEYKVKADELEGRLDRLEGRMNKEEMLAQWFESQDSDVTVQPILKKGMGMVSRRPVEVDKLILVCPPYVCVPYEPRKRFVCAYCFKEFKYLEEKYKREQEAQAALESGETVVAQESDSSPSITPSDPSAPPKHSLDASFAELSVEGQAGPQSTEQAPEVPPMPESIISELTNCSGCKEVWYCNEECRLADLAEHGQYECKALASFDIPWAKGYYSYCDDLVTDIRLLIRAINKRVWQEDQGINEFHEEYQLLISNLGCYQEDVLASLRSIVQYANYLLPNPINVPEDELLEIYCKHRVNMFGLWANGGECLGYGVYPRASYFNHSCWPNTTFYKNPDLKIPHMNFTTVWPIEKEGEEVCISYIDISVGLRDRRGTLLDKYFFHCTCERCMLQELSPQEPDPYFIYWAPAPPPDAPQESTEGPASEPGPESLPAEAPHDNSSSNGVSHPTEADDSSPFEAI